eukprot:COSAG02_NODE_52360_length_308_cov_0.755981_1_plen_36_part_10
MKIRVSYYVNTVCVSLHTWYKRSGTYHIRRALRSKT